MKKVLLLTTEDWPEIHEAVKKAKNTLRIQIDLKHVPYIDVSKDFMYETTDSWSWLELTKTKSLKSGIIYALGKSLSGGKEYDCYGIIVDKDKAHEKSSLNGQHSVYNGKSVIEVYAYKGRKGERIKWGYPATTYTLIHELIHFLDTERGVTGNEFHQYLRENEVLDKYIQGLLGKPKGLLPLVERKKDLFFRYAKILGYDLRVVSGYRSLAEQARLYQQGRGTLGKIVTNAKAGESMHNYGVAIDVVDRKRGYSLTDKQWWWIGLCGKLAGFEWGGDWKSFVDKPHFEMTLGYSIKDFQQKNVNYSKFI